MPGTSASGGQSGRPEPVSQPMRTARSAECGRLRDEKRPRRDRAAPGEILRNRLLHIADLHLGDSHGYLGSGAKDRAREADQLFHRITDYVLESKMIGGVLIAGDLFDHYAPPSALVDSVLSDLQRLREAGVRTLTVPGNHDEYSYPGCVYRERESSWPDTLVTRPLPGLVAQWTLDETTIDLYAMAYVAGRSRPPFDAFDVEPSSARKIAVLHGALDEGRPPRHRCPAWLAGMIR